MESAETEISRKRDTAYDWVRLIATLLVVLGHSFYLRNSTGIGFIDYSLPDFAARMYSGGILGILEKLSHFVYLFHMPLFFILSGAVLALKPLPDLKTLVKSKVGRLLLPCWLYGIFYMLPMKMWGGFYSGKTVFQILGSFLLCREYGHLWFLPALFWCILLFAGIRKVMQRWTDSPLAPLAVSLVLAPLFGKTPGVGLQLRTGIGYLSCFAVGYWFQSMRNNRKTDAFPQVFLVGLAALLGTGVFFILGKVGSFLGVLTISLLIFCISRLCAQYLQSFEKTGFWDFLIRNLFYVYIFHDPMEYVIVRVFLESDMLETAAGCWLMWFLRFAGTLVLSLLLGEGICILKRKGLRKHTAPSS